MTDNTKTAEIITAFRDAYLSIIKIEQAEEQIPVLDEWKGAVVHEEWKNGVTGAENKEPLFGPIFAEILTAKHENGDPIYDLETRKWAFGKIDETLHTNGHVTLFQFAQIADFGLKTEENTSIKSAGNKLCNNFGSR